MIQGQSETTILISCVLGPILLAITIFQLGHYRKHIADLRNGIITGKTSFHRLPTLSRRLRFGGMFLFGSLGLAVHHQFTPFPAQIITIGFIALTAVGLVGVIYPGWFGDQFQKYGHDPNYEGTPWFSALIPRIAFLLAGAFLTVEGWIKNNPNLPIQ